MSENDELPGPRHRKPGRARKRGSAPSGRHLRAVPDLPAERRAEMRAEHDSCACPDGYHEYGAHAPGHRPADAPSVTQPGAYPVEDLAAMSPGAASMLLRRATREAEVESTRLPHLVITRDLETQVVTYSGPFATGLEALKVASRFVEQNRAVHPAWRFTLTVAPLLPH